LFEENLFLYFYQQLLTKTYGYSETQAWHIFSQLIDTQYLPFDTHYWLSIKTAFLQDLSKYWWQAAIIWLQNALKNCFGLYTRAFMVLEQPALQKNLISFFTAGMSLSSIKSYLMAGSLFSAWLGFYECFYSGIRWALLSIGVGQQKKDLVFWLTLLSGIYFLGMLCMSGNGRYRFVYEPLGIVFSAHVLQVYILTVPNLKKLLIRRVV
jgi:hypothetical protein